MSDSTQQYILRKPLKAFVENDQYDEACYAVVADDGLAWQFMDKESFDELFKPLDIPAIEKQLETKFEDAIDCGYLLGKAELAKVRTLDELVEVQKIRIRQLTDEVLVLFGLENKEKQMNDNPIGKGGEV